MSKFLKRMLTDESGASAAEYAILLAAVGTAVVAALVVFTAGIAQVFTNLTAQMILWVS
jgi:Flp pilus assembly pilin Flp